MRAWVKSNLAPAPPSLGFRIVADAGRPRLEWTGPLDVTADELHGVPRARRAEALDRAMEFLKETLRLGPLPHNEISKRARDAGISERTLARAKSECHMLSQLIRRGGKQRWLWYLKEHADLCNETPEARSLREAEEERDRFLAALHGKKSGQWCEMSRIWRRKLVE
jgi:hypothetical protein